MRLQWTPNFPTCHLVLHCGPRLKHLFTSVHIFRPSHVTAHLPAKRKTWGGPLKSDIPQKKSQYTLTDRFCLLHCIALLSGSWVCAVFIPLHHNFLLSPCLPASQALPHPLAPPHHRFTVFYSTNSPRLGQKIQVPGSCQWYAAPIPVTHEQLKIVCSPGSLLFAGNSDFLAGLVH